MEEELVEFVKEMFADEEIDMDYEFDAPRFFDLSRAETYSEAKEAELWFESAGNYSPSPFIIKLNWRQGIPIRVVNTFSKSKDVEDVNANNRGVHYQITQDLSQGNAKCQVKSTVSRSSTLMKPTISHLAKQNHISITSLRLQKKLGNIDDKSSLNSSVIDDLATKRQKLEAGYSSKNALLKHRALLSHKVSKKVRLDGVIANSRPNATTIPREPVLETAHRAERRRHKVNAESGERPKSMSYNFKADDTNRKILKAPSLPFTRRKKQQLPEFQEKDLPDCSLHSETTEGKRPDSVNSLRQEKCKTVNSLEACCPNKKKLSVAGKFCISRNINQGHNFPTDKCLQDEPPVHLFSKLCLTSESQENTKPQSKTLPSEDTRENTPGSLFQEHKMIKSKKNEEIKCKGFCCCGCGLTIRELQLYVKSNATGDLTCTRFRVQLLRAHRIFGSSFGA